MTIKEKENIVFRVMMFFLLFFVLSIVIILRIIMIQTVGYDKYKNLLMKNHFRKNTIKASRGEIYSVDNILLATTIIRYHIYLDLKIINQKIFDKNIDALSDSLNLVFNKSPKTYKQILIEQKKKKSILFTCP